MLIDVALSEALLCSKASLNVTLISEASIIIILESAVQGRERVRTLSVLRPQPHTTNPWKEEKDKTVGDKKERADHANRKTLTLLLKLTEFKLFVDISQLA